MSNKTKEEIEQLAIFGYGNDPNSFGGQRDGFVNGYTQCQETLTAQILELEAQIKNSIIQGLSEISCKDDVKCCGRCIDGIDECINDKKPKTKWKR